jgi:hypothetical protein
MLGPTNRATYTTTNPSERSGLHEPRELGQGLGASHARITQAPELDHMPPCPLEVGIGKRAGLIERAAMAVVARVEAVLGHKLRESHGFTRHSEKRAARESRLYAAFGEKVGRASASCPVGIVTGRYLSRCAGWTRLA